MADIYRIGVSIAMTNGVSQTLGVISRDLLGLNANILAAEKGFGRIRLAATGLLGVAVGSAMLGGVAKLAEHGKEFVHQQALMAEAGIAQADIARMTASAWKTVGDVAGSSAEKNIALVHDLRDALGDVNEAVRAMPAIAKLGVFLGNGTGQDQERAGFAAARFIEQRGGLVDPKTHQVSEARLEQQVKLVEAIAAGTRFRVGPDQLLAFQQIARASGALLSDQGLINMAPVIAASKSPSSVGNQLSSLQQQLLGGVTTEAGARYLERLGVIDASKVHVGRGGHIKFDNGAVVDAQLAGTDPVAYINKYIRGGLERMGATTADQQSLSLMSSHLRATVVGLLNEVVRSYPAFQSLFDHQVSS